MTSRIQVGQIFSKLTVQSYAGGNHRKERLWLCKCKCGNETVVKSRNLHIGKTRSCGCIKTGTPTKDLVGMVFGQLTVISLVGVDKNRSSLWLCKCKCGNDTTVRRAALIKGKVKGCGCLNKGAKHYNWNPLLTDMERSVRGRSRHQSWARKVKQRENYTCQKCKQRGKNVIAHHIRPYWKYAGERFLVENGACLCVECHKSFHRSFGNKTATEIDYSRWINEPV